MSCDFPPSILLALGLSKESGSFFKLRTFYVHDLLFESFNGHNDQTVHLIVVTDEHEGELGGVVDVTFLFGHAEDSVSLGHEEETRVFVIEDV